MSIEDYMVGDWLYNSHHMKKTRITPYDFFTHGHDAYGRQYLPEYAKPQLGRDWEPIPLTGEILEKNGFSLFGEGAYVLFNEDMSIKFSLRFPSKDNFWLTIGHKQYPILGVHELQHALKLCGINKEITI